MMIEVVEQGCVGSELVVKVKNLRSRLSWD